METPKHPLLDSLKKDLEYYKPAIKEVSTEVIEKKLSNYPIFVAHQAAVSLGEVILDKNDYNTNWTINATVLEELVEKGVIQLNKQDDFKTIYKNPKEYICIFLISEKGGNFIFYPYGKEEVIE